MKKGKKERKKEIGTEKKKTIYFYLFSDSIVSYRAIQFFNLPQKPLFIKKVVCLGF
jgi:hypothetical protein